MTEKNEKYEFPQAMPGLFGPSFHQEGNTIKPQIFVQGPTWNNDLQAQVYQVVITPFKDKDEAMEVGKKLQIWFESMEEK